MFTAVTFPGIRVKIPFAPIVAVWLIERYGYTVRQMHLKGSACSTCETPLDGNISEQLTIEGEEERE